MSIIKEFIRENFHRQKESASGHKRIEFIDLAKGFCILLVILVHADFTTSITVLIPLRIPLYFILSGLFFKDYGGFFYFLIKKINRLVVPLLFFFALGLVIRFSTDPKTPIVYEILQPFIEPTIHNAPLWFLFSLFWVNLLYFFVHTGMKNFVSRLILCLLIGVTGLILDYYKIYLPLFLSSAFSATPFFFVGVMLRKFPILYETKHDKAIIGFAVVILLALSVYSQTLGTPYIFFAKNFYVGNYLEILFYTILMVTSFLIICKAVKWLPIISYLGRYSIIVLCLHDIFLGYAYLPVYHFTGHSMSNLEILILTLILSWISIPVFKKYLKKFCAQEDLIVLHKSI